MTRITDIQKAACRTAAANDLPFALWRDPHGSEFAAMISTTPPREATVFDPDNIAGFVMAPFDTNDGSIAWRFDADILVTTMGMQCREGIGFEPDESPAPLRAPAAVIPDPVPVSREAYQARVARAVTEIRRGICAKIVLSRVEPRALPKDADLLTLTEALARAHPHAFVSLVSSAVTGTWLTATPELLLGAGPDGIKTMALAGTQWPPEGTDPASLSWSDKIIEEQGLVAEYIRSAFADAGISGVSETAPATIRAANLCHLRSDFSAPATPPQALSDLLRRLHPTSAVCGMPKTAARDHIRKEEGSSRGFYTGYLGPVGVNGKTELHVNLRSARASRDQLFLHVGGGIVAASEPELEWQETVEKAKTIGQIL